MMFLVSVGIIFLDAVILRDCWRWFIEPLGVPALGYWHAFGLLFMWEWLKHSPSYVTNERTIEQRLRESLFVSLLAWGVCALVTA